MKTCDQLIRLWTKYQVTETYSNGISFDNLFDSLNYITNILGEEEVIV